MKQKRRIKYQEFTGYLPNILDKIDNIVIGTKHDTIEEAIAADIISAIPVGGAVSDFIRLVKSEDKKRKVFQAVDLITSPLPLSDLFTPTNTFMYLSDKGFLPIDVGKIENIFDTMKSPKDLFLKINKMRKK